MTEKKRCRDCGGSGYARRPLGDSDEIDPCGTCWGSGEGE